MDYYILLPDDTEATTINDSNHLGTTSFNIFWAGEGLNALLTIANDAPEMLEYVRIISAENKQLTVADFMDIIETLEVRN